MPHHNPDNQNKKQVDHVDLAKINRTQDLIHQWQETGVFSGNHLARAVKILDMALDDSAAIFVGMAGAMVPGGMRKVICQAMRNGYIQALTTTGATITHDVIEAIGGSHIHSVEYKDDNDLRERGIDRVYDSFVAEGSFEGFEDYIQLFLRSLMEEEAEDGKLIISPSELIDRIGSKLDDQDSIVKTAHDLKIPIFVPAISDSVLGLQIWMFSQFNKLIVDATTDLGRIQDLFHETPTNCALLLGGGVPKNFTLQSALMATKHYKYAVQITMDRVETGGLSGATLEEAKSWGKLEPDAQIVNVTCDLTIALPILFSALTQIREDK